MKVNKILFVVVSIIIFIFLALFIVTPKKEFSEIENRYLKDFDVKDMNGYFSDHFPFRSRFVIIKNNIEVLMGKNLINGIYVGDDDYLIPQFVRNENRDYLIKSINKFVENRDNVDVMIVPDSIGVNGDKISNLLPDSQEDEIEYIYSKLENTNNIKVLDSLRDNNSKSQMYYKTDHHWTSYGAFTAYQKYFNDKGKVPLNIDDFNEKKVSDEFLGTSSSLALGLAKEEEMFILEKDNSLKVNYVYEEKVTNSLYNYDYLEKKDKYAMFLDNNHGLITIENMEINDNSNVLIIKNSYANCFVPFMVNHYQNIHIIDLRYFGGSVSDYVGENKIDNILILYNLNNFYSDMSIIKLK